MAVLALGLILSVVLFFLSFIVISSIVQARKEQAAEALRLERLRFEQLQAEVQRVAARRRKALRADLAIHQSLVRSLTELARWTEQPPIDSPQARLKETVVIAAVEEKAVATLGREIPDLWPAAGRLPAPSSPTDTETLSHLDKLVQNLEQHSLIVAGVEQAFLGLLADIESNSAALSVAIQHFGGVLPEPLQEAGRNLIHSVMTSPAGGLIHAHGADVLHGVALHVGLKILEHGSGPAGSLFAAAEIVKMSTPEPVSRVLEGMVHGGAHAAGAHLMDTAAHVGLGSVLHSISLGNVGGAHFPIITAAISFNREWNLLQNDKTSIEIALKNAGLDIAGTGFGAFAGMQAGGAIGTALLPGPGTVIGGAVGAVGGAIAGRFFSDEVKRRPLRQAIVAYQNEWNTAPSRIQSLQVALAKVVLEQYSDRRKAFQRDIKPPPTAEQHSAEWRTVAIDLRNTARGQTEQARVTVGAARRWANNDHLIAGQLALVAPTIDQVDAAIGAGDARLAAGDYPGSMISIAAAPIRLPPDICNREEERLMPLIETERLAVGNWMVATSQEFKMQKQRFEEAVAPQYRAYQVAQDQILNAVKQAADNVKTEKDRLGASH